MAHPYVGWWWFKAKKGKPVILRIYSNKTVVQWGGDSYPLDEILARVVDGGKLVRIEEIC